MTQVDHYTPLSRAVASIDRDAYAARFAIYDRAHKALLRRLATGEIPCGDADIEREEHAFRDAIRRIEFADELPAEQLAEPEPAPPLVPQRGPAEEALQELRRDAPWPEVRVPRESLRDNLETFDRLPEPSLEPAVSDETFGPVARLRRRSRSLTRRVGERLALAVAVLMFGAAWVMIADGRRGAVEDSSAPPAVEAATETNAQADAADVKPQQPAWLSPELFYSAPNLPPRPPAPAPVRRP